jgi:hypothetical protein
VRMVPGPTRVAPMPATRPPRPRLIPVINHVEEESGISEYGSCAMSFLWRLYRQGDPARVWQNPAGSGE